PPLPPPCGPDSNLRGSLPREANVAVSSRFALSSMGAMVRSGRCRLTGPPGEEANMTVGGSRFRGTQVALMFLLAMAAGPGTGHAIIMGHKWVSIGPAPGCCQFPQGETGRASAIAVDPYNADDVWIGTAGGGVWHSSDGTSS